MKVMASRHCSARSLSLTSIVLINFLYPFILGAPNHSPEFYRIHPQMSVRQKITGFRNIYTGDDPTESLPQAETSSYDLLRLEEAERSPDLQDVQMQYDDKRNAPASQQCEEDDAQLCVKERHPKCSVLFPESENAQDSNCKIRLECGFTCSARCFAIQKAFPTVIPNTTFRFSVVTYYGNGTTHFPHRTWNGRLRSNATSTSLNVLQNHGSIGGKFRITSSFNCANYMPCDYNLTLL